MRPIALPLFTVAALLAACASNSRNSDTTMQPGQSAPSRADSQRGDPGGPGGRGRGGAGRADAMLLRGVTLSTDQQQRVDSIRTRYRTQMDQARQQNGSGDRSAARGQMRTMMERQQAEIRAILRPDQQRVFDQNVTDMRSRRQQGGGRPGAPPLQ